jgi:ABC-type phosphate transport system substrate-binding protein
MTEGSTRFAGGLSRQTFTGTAGSAGVLRVAGCTENTRDVGSGSGDGDDGGGGCTEPNLDNAKDGSYPMARPLFMDASEESLQREKVYEYVEFYLENAETDAIKDIGYVPSGTELRDSNLETLDEMAGN